MVSSTSRNSKTDEWTWVTDGTSWADKPMMVTDGRLIYFVTQEGGLGNVWGVEFDPIAGKPVGRPFQLTRFAGPGERMGRTRVSKWASAAAEWRSPSASTGGIWILENFKR